MSQFEKMAAEIKLLSAKDDIEISETEAFKSFDLI